MHRAAEAASDWFCGGVVAYASSVKYKVLGVDPGPGEPRALPAEVTLIVSSGPPAVTDPGAFPDSAAAPDTSAAPPR